MAPIDCKSRPKGPPRLSFQVMRCENSGLVDVAITTKVNPWAAVIAATIKAAPDIRSATIRIIEAGIAGVITGSEPDALPRWEIQFSSLGRYHLDR